MLNIDNCSELRRYSIKYKNNLFVLIALIFCYKTLIKYDFLPYGWRRRIFFKCEVIQ